MNTLAHLVVIALAVVCVGIPVAAAVMVYIDEIATLGDRLHRAVTPGSRRAALDDRRNG